MIQRTVLLLSVQCVCLFLCCSPRYAKNGLPYSFDNSTSTPDYSNLQNWAAHPDKADPSDSVPGMLKNAYKKDSAADVFFLHPTTLTSDDDTSWNAEISNTILNAKTDRSTILYQASAFNECRVFAPRYRQAHIRAYYTRDTSAASKALDIAYQDVKEAFLYYLDRYNNGKPIIIAAHSQGSTHAQRLLKEYFEEGDLKNRLVVAYLPGMYIPGNYFTELTACKDSLQTGCLTGWRTYKRGYLPAFVESEKTTSLVTNPLTWKTTNEYAGYQLNEGGVITNFNKLRPHISDARVHNGVLWIGTPRIPGSFLLRMKNFHIGDINLFYMSIRQNLRQRIRAYQMKQESTRTVF